MIYLDSAWMGLLGACKETYHPTIAELRNLIFCGNIGEAKQREVSAEAFVEAIMAAPPQLE